MPPGVNRRPDVGRRHRSVRQRGLDVGSGSRARAQDGRGAVRRVRSARPGARRRAASTRRNHPTPRARWRRPRRRGHRFRSARDVDVARRAADGAGGAPRRAARDAAGRAEQRRHVGRRLPRSLASVSGDRRVAQRQPRGPTGTCDRHRGGRVLRRGRRASRPRARPRERSVARRDRARSSRSAATASRSPSHRGSRARPSGGPRSLRSGSARRTRGVPESASSRTRPRL